jgi:hypothetical protein
MIKNLIATANRHYTATAIIGITACLSVSILCLMRLAQIG